MAGLGLVVALSACSAATTGSGDTTAGPGPSSTTTVSGTPTPPSTTGSPTTGAATKAPSLACGETTFEDGHQAVRYCGKGTARVEQGDSTTIAGSLCEDRGAFLTVHFGVNYSEEESAKGSYLGLLLGGVTSKAQPAPATLSGFELIVDGTRVTAKTATVQARRTATQLTGTLAGTLVSGAPLTGSFTCPLA